jgi:hypothetical protein
VPQSILLPPTVTPSRADQDERAIDDRDIGFAMSQSFDSRYAGKAATDDHDMRSSALRSRRDQ